MIEKRLLSALSTRPFVIFGMVKAGQGSAKPFSPHFYVSRLSKMQKLWPCSRVRRKKRRVAHVFPSWIVLPFALIISIFLVRSDYYSNSRTATIALFRAINFTAHSHLSVRHHPNCSPSTYFPKCVVLQGSCRINLRLIELPFTERIFLHRNYPSQAEKLPRNPF